MRLLEDGDRWNGYHGDTTMKENIEEVAIGYPSNQTMPNQFVCATTNLVKFFLDKGLTPDQAQKGLNYVAATHLNV